MKKKQVYEAPELTVVKFRAERGFAVSSAVLNTDLHLFEWSNDDPHVTQYDVDNSWAGYDWN